MPDEKIDQKRPVEAAAEPKKEQQRIVDDTVDDSFPASDPPAWTNAGNKSVAAQYDEHGRPIRGDSAADVAPSDASDIASDVTRRASEMASSAYEQGQRYFEEGRRRYPEVERYARQAAGMAYDAYDRAQDYLRRGAERYPQVGNYSRTGMRAVEAPVRQYPIAALLAAAAAGYFLATLMQSRSGGSRRDFEAEDFDGSDHRRSPKPHGDKYAGAVRRSAEHRP